MIIEHHDNNIVKEVMEEYNIIIINILQTMPPLPVEFMVQYLLLLII